MHQCTYCRALFDTQRGVRQHISMSNLCLLASTRITTSHTLPDRVSNSIQQVSQRPPTMPAPPTVSQGSLATSGGAHLSRLHTPPSIRIGYFPTPAGQKREQASIAFELTQSSQLQNGLLPWAPFASYEEWKLARWLQKSGVSRRKIDDFLKSVIVRLSSIHCETDQLTYILQYEAIHTASPAHYSTFKDSRTHLKCIDALPFGLAHWKAIDITYPSDIMDSQGKPVIEALELWARDPVECVAELIGNPSFKHAINYAPVKVFEHNDTGEQEQVFGEMNSAEWWWRVQVSLLSPSSPPMHKFNMHLQQKELPEGATVAPVILSSDKTQLSVFSGDKSAWPVYLTIGNIHKSIRRQPSQHATILLGYLPVTKFATSTKKDHSGLGQRLFHFAMAHLLDPLIHAGTAGVFMTCADGYVRHVFPILACYIADHPEQCLVACVKENHCPIGLVERDRRGEPICADYRDETRTLNIIRNRTNSEDGQSLELYGIRDVYTPFWSLLPFTNIFTCITPDLLHQLHKGVFKDHLVKWTTSASSLEIDARYMRLPPYNGLKEFKRGISGISQWTGTEYRHMEKVFIAVLCGIHDMDSRLLVAARAILDFIYLAHYPRHTESTLSDMQEALFAFHENKQVFIDNGARQHFNIPKIHSMVHYIPSIINYGTCDGFSTEISERLHIEYAKFAYRASNRKAYIKQMVVWLTRQEKVSCLDAYMKRLNI